MSRVVVVKGAMLGGGMNWDLGVDICTLLYIKWRCAGTCCIVGGHLLSAAW